jgi:tRNA-2-methylthio-N6-dimethylallyladenosine synthase
MLKRESYIDMVVWPKSYQQIPDLILKYQRNKKKINHTKFEVVKKFDELKKIPNLQNKVSSYLTIQEGCDKFCHFCVVPYTRGPEYSRPFDEIINEANKLVDNGAREIILLGQNVNAYQFELDNKKYKLSYLIKELNNIKKLKRIRYMTSHPKDMTEDLINCYNDYKKLMPLLHLPVQSGSNKILKSMNRKHDREYYLSIIKKLKRVNKDIKFTSDFIIGYPGETQKDFEDTINLIEEIGFLNSYSFIFSPRPGTPTALKKLNNYEESKKRLKKLKNVLESYQLKNNQSNFDNYCEVLVENKLSEEKKYFGRTKFMTPVKFESSSCKPGDLVNVKITSFSHTGLFGVSENKKVKAA